MSLFFASQPDWWDWNREGSSDLASLVLCGGLCAATGFRLYGDENKVVFSRGITVIAASKSSPSTCRFLPETREIIHVVYFISALSAHCGLNHGFTSQLRAKDNLLPDKLGTEVQFSYCLNHVSLQLPAQPSHFWWRPALGAGWDTYVPCGGHKTFLYLPSCACGQGHPLEQQEGGKTRQAHAVKARWAFYL